MDQTPTGPIDPAEELEHLKKGVRRLDGTARAFVKARIYELQKQLGLETRYRTGGFKDRRIPPGDQ